MVFFPSRRNEEMEKSIVYCMLPCGTAAIGFSDGKAAAVALNLLQLDRERDLIGISSLDVHVSIRLIDQ